MLIRYFKSPLTLERYRSASVGSHLDAFTAWLDEHGYRRVSVRRHVREVVHFAAWAKKTGIPVSGLNRAALDRLRSYLVKRDVMHHRTGGHQHLYQSACILVGFLEATGVVRGSRPTPKHQLLPRDCGATAQCSISVLLPDFEYRSWLVCR
jgi:hypothetical protein